MSETKYESKITSIPAPVEAVYKGLSNFKNLERVRDLIPQDKVQELDIEDDSIRMKVDGLGQKIVIRIVDRIENDTIKFGFENLPLSLNFWIQLKEVAPEDTRMKLTLKADIPMMFKMMFEKKIQQGIDDAAEMIAKMPFKQW
ncbi:MAG: SRPBCC family protein [Paludibacteraceae bacterium]|nr:SRPBCC family protein [Paludibacteraceae bacterium]